MNRKFLFYTILICLIILLFLSCPTVPPEEDDWDTFTGYTVSGTLTRADANGKTAYLKLVAHGEFYTSDALYLDSSTQFVIGSATYSKGGVSAGNYTGWIFIDMNGNANPSDPLPDTGDYYVENENINITSDTVINVLEGDWDTFTGYTVSGTLTRADANGKTAYLKLVEQGAGYTDTALYKAVSSVFAGGIATYSKDDVFTENYTGWIFIDMNGNVNASNPLPDTGDYYATTDINVSGNTVINVNEGDWSTL